ncbi:sensor histidine kinase [Phnomibacter ginsenosidimutans]|uniref:histidine kinase n=1 Tax=Phnomibacter ginsenosidimutans TaxID=2676868 RepID=A0A6I6GJI1_9BACT|nr:HAMP domain-containing sensor histidine kinase [Phnomibacter ginsenosidimutans]QGW28575.1 GHKL domain-containing protein [Phnomibacter ginsenosidimutans]
MSKRKKYIPHKTLNPANQRLRLDSLKLELQNLGKTIDALSKSHDNHISYLGNFAKHDIKNSIQSMDSILSTNTLKELTDEHLLSLKTNLKVIRQTMENFAELIPYSQDETFSITSLISAVELLNRNIFFEKKIEFFKKLPQEIDVRFKLPFQSVLQMFNNIIINAIKSCDGVENPKIKLEVSVNQMVIIHIFDNGTRIPKDNIEKIFNFGFSTTGGSGIGLYHAKYICDLLKGDIQVELTDIEPFTKAFRISLPYTHISGI